MSLTGRTYFSRGESRTFRPKSVRGEMQEILCSNVVLVIKKHELEPKVVRLYTDKCNTNFGKEEKRDEDYVYS
jgi:hypothetical protein